MSETQPSRIADVALELIPDVANVFYASEALQVLQAEEDGIEAAMLYARSLYEKFSCLIDKIRNSNCKSATALITNTSYRHVVELTTHLLRASNESEPPSEKMSEEQIHIHAFCATIHLQCLSLINALTELAGESAETPL